MRYMTGRNTGHWLREDKLAGRRLGEVKARNRSLHVRIPLGMDDALKAVAKKYCVTRSQAARLLISWGVAAMEANGPER